MNRLQRGYHLLEMSLGISVLGLLLTYTLPFYEQLRSSIQALSPSAMMADKSADEIAANATMKLERLSNYQENQKVELKAELEAMKAYKANQRY